MQKIKTTNKIRHWNWEKHEKHWWNTNVAIIKKNCFNYKEYKIWTKTFYVYKIAYEKVHRTWCLKCTPGFAYKGKLNKKDFQSHQTLIRYMLLCTKWMYVCFFIQLQLAELNLIVIEKLNGTNIFGRISCSNRW